MTDSSKVFQLHRTSPTWYAAKQDRYFRTNIFMHYARCTRDIKGYIVVVGNKSLWTPTIFTTKGSQAGKAVSDKWRKWQNPPPIAHGRCVISDLPSKKSDCYSCRRCWLCFEHRFVRGGSYCGPDSIQDTPRHILAPNWFSVCTATKFEAMQWEKTDIMSFDWIQGHWSCILGTWGLPRRWVSLIHLCVGFVAVFEACSFPVFVDYLCLFNTSSSLSLVFLETWQFDIPQ